MKKDSYRFTRKELAELDARLALCARSQNPLLLCLGVALWRIRDSEGYQKLGYPSFAAYVRQRAQRSETAARDLALLARRLDRLPALREAFRRSAITLTVAQALAAVATPEDDAWMAAFAPRSTVRQVRAAMRAWKSAAGPSDFDDDDDPPCVIRRSASSAEKMMFLGSVMRLEHAGGRSLKGNALIEAVCAEVEFFLLGKVPEPVKGFDDDAHALKIIAREESLAARDAAERRAEPSLPPVPVIEVAPEPEIPTDIVELDVFIHDVCAVLAGLELEIGRLAKDIVEDGGWKRLGFGSRQQYAAERAGMCLRTFESRRRLGRAAEEMPSVAKAVQARQIGLTVATMITHVADPKTAPEWVALSQRRTVKHLREDVEAARAHDVKRPPTAEELEATFALRRRAAGLVDPEASRQMSAASLTRENAEVVIPCTQSWRDRWYEVENMWRAAGSPYHSFLLFCVVCIWRSHPIEDIELAYLDVYLRDGWQCTSPVCTSRNVTPHHPHRRSQGGTDERHNVTSDCLVCHLVLIHTLCTLYVSGRAPDDLTWTIGPAETGMVVKGREVIRAPGRAKAA